jgi:hypothetical protein
MEKDRVLVDSVVFVSTGSLNEQIPISTECSITALINE